jgi:hypothetical protein
MPQDDDDPDKPVIYDLSTQKGRRIKERADRQAKLKRNRAKHKVEQDAKHKKCKSLTTTGMICKNLATTDDGLCYMHSKTEAERQLLVKQARAVRKQAKLKPHELMRVVIESNPIAFMQPYLDALGIRVVFLPDVNDPTVLHPTAVVDPASNGATLFGISKDGEVIVSKHKDIEKQQIAAERLFDRVYGKPKQTNIIAGAASQEDPQLVPFDAARQAEVAAILEAAKSPSHSMPANTQN